MFYDSKLHVYTNKSTYNDNKVVYNTPCWCGAINLFMVCGCVQNHNKKKIYQGCVHIDILTHKKKYMYKIQKKSKFKMAIMKYTSLKYLTIR